MTRPESFAVIGLGEVGQAFARGLHAGGARRIAVHDPQPSAAALACIDEIGATHAAGFAECLAEAEVALACVPGDLALRVAREAAADGALRPGTLFCDLSTASPEDMRRADAAVAPTGARFVDATIMGSVALSRHEAPITAAGPWAGALAAALNGYGFNVSTLPDSAPGDASALKLLRSVFMKGLEALAVEALVAARRYGLERRLLDSLADLDAVPVAAFLDNLVRTHTVHAVRRWHEVERARDQLEAAGVPTVVTPAVIDLFARTGRALPHRPPPPEAARELAAALAWLDHDEEGKTP